MARQKKTVQEKVQAEYPDFATEVASMSEEALNARLIAMAKGLEDSENEKEKDEDLEKARTLASELAAPYRDVKKAVQLKSRYIIALLNEQGKGAST